MRVDGRFQRNPACVCVDVVLRNRAGQFVVQKCRERRLGFVGWREIAGRGREACENGVDVRDAQADVRKYPC